jgi:hypothetical protein
MVQVDQDAGIGADVGCRHYPGSEAVVSDIFPPAQKRCGWLFFGDGCVLSADGVVSGKAKGVPGRQPLVGSLR